jgi:hypothetical protein
MNNKFKSSPIIFLFFVIQFTAHSQELPKVIPPTPEAAALFKYMDYPVDYSTGLPQISIPLYEIRSGSLSLPISISYHASGRKVSDETGAVGLGWTLQAGGMISRTIYGKPDDERWTFPSPFKRADELSNATDFLYLASVGHHPNYGFNPYYDTQYDIFSYSVNNLSGKFVLRDEYLAKTAAVTIPHKPHLIEWHKTTTQYVVQYFDYINITDDKGIVYRFGKSVKDGAVYLEKTSEGVSSWLLTEIISADKSDTISFKYKGFTGERISISQQSIITQDVYAGRVPQLRHNYEVTENETTNRSYYSMQRLTEIKFKQGKVLFSLNGTTNTITSLEIKNRKNETVKSVDFTLSALNAMSDGIKPVEKLDRVAFKDKFGNLAEKYDFNYYSSSSINVRACDMWGYYNAASTSMGIIDMRPFLIVPTGIFNQPPSVEFSYRGRVPSMAMQSGVLEKITYPTGGSTKFIYELNQFLDLRTQTPLPGGGLRIGQIITDDNEGNLLYKTFKYGEGENGYGFLNIIPSAQNITDITRYQNFSEVTNSPILNDSYTHRTVSADILPVFHFISQKPIIYKQVTEYHGTLADNIGKTVYKYDFDDRIAPQDVDALFRFSKYRFWRTSELREKSDYKSINNNGTITYDVQKTVAYNFTETETDLLYGLHLKKKYVCTIPSQPAAYASVDQYVAEVWGAGSGSGGGGGGGTGGPHGIDDWKVYLFGDYAISVGVKELVNVVETEFLAGNTVTTTTNYTYNEKRFVKETSKTVSQGQTLKTEIKYPFDFPGDPVHQQMIARNMLNVNIETNTFRGAVPLASVKNIYKDWGNNVIQPEFISTRTGANPYEQRTAFHAYDSQGKILSVSKDNSARFAYRYGYNEQLPIAQATNASNKQIFHTSFEEADGNSGENDAKTGRKSYTGVYNKPLTELPNGVYTLTYWQKAGSLWQFAQVDNISVTDGAYTINITGQIDEVRFYPQGAFMNTCTYDPLEGLLTTTDQNNLTTYYGQDGYQRLMSIKDLNQHTIKQIDYHYKE